MASRGLHHLTAIVGSAACTVDFYTRVLGLGLVKRTVSFADPGSHHLYFRVGIDRAEPLLTFLVWTGVAPCRRGCGEAERILFWTGAGALDWWRDRLAGEGADPETASLPDGTPVLHFDDPDGVPGGIVALPGSAAGPPAPGIPAQHALGGVLGVALAVRDAAGLVALLHDVLAHDVLALRDTGCRDGLFQLSAADAPGGTVLLRGAGRAPRGRQGRGTIARVAFRGRMRASRTPWSGGCGRGTASRRPTRGTTTTTGRSPFANRAASCSISRLRAPA